jgi:hypothetical protein
MRITIIILAAAASLAGCSQSTGNATANEYAGNGEQAAKPKPAAYCFFKDSETKEWKAKADKSGNVVVTGKVYRQDSRYKAVLSPATVSGEKAEIAPTITQNDGAFGAPNDWWDVSQTIPDSQGVSTVTVKCGDETVATLTMPRKK